MQNFLTLFVIAMESEAKDLIFNFEKINDVPELYKKDNHLVVITGIGKTNASFVLSYVLAKYNINLVVNLGFVGAYGDFNIGDKVAVKEAKYHDFDLSLFGYEHGQVPNMPTYYKTEEKLFKTHLNAYNSALLLTGDYFQTKPINDNFIADMEGASLFQVCHLLNVPIISIKVVSDVINRENHFDEYKDFESNGSKYIKEIYDSLEV